MYGGELSWWGVVQILNKGIRDAGYKELRASECVSQMHGSIQMLGIIIINSKNNMLLSNIHIQLFLQPKIKTIMKLKPIDSFGTW